jgi:serine/threonine protein kinase/tetratricopeptide (TPR) repeat protein
MTEKLIIGGRYEIDSLIGQGGMGDVFRGKDIQTGETVAIKSLRMAAVVNDSEMVQRFRREGDVLRRLNHPNIVKMLGTVEDGDQHYIIMEYVRGGSLQNLMRQQPQMPLSQILKIGLELADALSRAHHLKIIHRDLKPANVLIAEDGTPRLTDFGLAQIGDAPSLTQSGMLMGTYGYLSPEACKGLILDERADIWAMGVLIYEMLTGQMPFEANNVAAILMAVQSRPTPRVNLLRPDSPEKLNDLIYQMLAKERDERVSSIRQVGAALESLVKRLDTDERVAIRPLAPISPDAPTPKAQPLGDLSIAQTIAPSPIPVSPPRGITPPPFSAPSRLNHILVGRDDLIREYKPRLMVGENLAIVGLPGVGKTAFVVALLYDSEVLRHFSDGILWVGLGRDPDILSRLGDWCLSLGMSSNDLTDLRTVESRAQAIRSAIGERRMLLVIDDVWAAGDAAAFRVGGPNCTYIVTSRSPEVAFEFGDEGVLTVPELSQANGLTLLEWFVPEIVKSKPHEALELVQAAGGLPLAIMLMGKYLRKKTRDGQPRRITTVIDQLRNSEARLRLEQQQSPLERLSSLPPGMALSLVAVISVSDEALDDEARKTLRALSVFPPKPNTFSEEAALVVCGGSIGSFDALADAGLMESMSPGRYAFHQTITDYARASLKDDAPYQRLAAFFIEFAAENGENYTTLDIEKDNLIASLEAAENWQMREALVQGINIFYPFLDSRGLYDLAAVHLKRAEAIARGDGEQRGLDMILLNLGLIAEKRLDYDEAERKLQESLTLARDGGHLPTELDALLGLGEVALHQSDWGLAEQYHQDALELARQVGDRKRASILLSQSGVGPFYEQFYDVADERWGEGLREAEAIGYLPGRCRILSQLGGLEITRRNFDKADNYLTDGLKLAYKLGHREMIIRFLHNLGGLKIDREQHREAEEHLLEALELAREIGDLFAIQHSLTNLAEVANNREHYFQAEIYIQQCLELSRTSGDLYPAAVALNIRGEMNLKQENLEVAAQAFQDEFDTAQSADMPEQQYWMGMGLYGLAQVAAAREDFVEARRQAEASIPLITTIDAEKGAEVEAWAAKLPR